MACSKLRTVELGDEIESIDMGAFSYCTYLQAVSLPDSLRVIGERVFSDCESLSSVKICRSVRSIGMGAFENCSSLSYLDYAGSEAELDGIELPEGGWPSVGTFIIRCGS